MVESRSVLLFRSSLDRRVTGSERVKFFVKNFKKLLAFYWNYVKSDSGTKVEGFQEVFYVWLYLILSVPKKFEINF